MRVLFMTMTLGLFLATIGIAPVRAEDSAQRTFSVQGMTCAMCGKAISKALYQVEGVSKVEVDEKAERIVVVASSDVTPDTLEATIESAGNYEAEPISTP